MVVLMDVHLVVKLVVVMVEMKVEKALIIMIIIRKRI